MRSLGKIFIAIIIIVMSIGSIFAVNGILLPEEDILTQEEINGLLKMREEEKLAYEVNSYLYKKWDFIIFKNIAESELRHTNSIKYILVYYGIDDPYQEGIGNYSNPEFKNLYQELIKEGSKSFENALKTGAKIEDLDIADLNELKSQTKNSRILQTYENLVRSSRNHLRNFVHQLQIQGIVYSPKFLVKSEFDTIISADMETGRLANNKGNRMNNQSMKKRRNNQNGQMKGRGNRNKRKGRGNCNGNG
jgi:hypothetical protein